MKNDKATIFLGFGWLFHDAVVCAKGYNRKLITKFESDADKGSQYQRFWLRFWGFGHC